MTEASYDVVIAGTGVGGLYCALNLDRGKRILMLTKARVEECDSFLAQGGICVLKSEDDYDSYFEDTMRAGHYENNKKSVDTMIRNSRKTIDRLISYGVDFERNGDGSLKFTKEGAHSTPRILFHQDITGKEITSKLLAAVRRLPNVEILEMTEMTDIVVEDGVCAGILARNLESGEEFRFLSRDVVWATGGIGGMYEHSTNFPHLTGDALSIAKRHGIPVIHEDYVQIHPTTLYVERADGKKERSFLISESVRGEGGILLGKNMERFVDELLPRDKVTEAIKAQMEKDGTKHVWLSMRKIDPVVIKTHFEHIYERCLEEGIDCTKDLVPVVPAQHYFMGGVAVDDDSMTSMQHLYAVGETSCNGVHGRNRLASNSLLESLVFAEIAANKINMEGERK
ncbi:MAG: L-aspartate oxidase [Treponema sp.]|nr:L-aspartate oxidase [Treponema sp.]